MAVILYIETNFLMGIATGRDAQANDLLQALPSQVSLIISSVCYMEALSAFESVRKYRQRFNNELNLQISELRRDLTSSHARSLLFYLEQSVVENNELLSDIKARLSQAVTQLSTKAEQIPLTTNALLESMRTTLIQEPTDNLILHCILNHARLYPIETKVLLSSNSQDFGLPEVQEALQGAGIERYFSHTQAFLHWLNSQSTS